MAGGSIDRGGTPKVFVSSTAEDLKPYRAAARDAAIGAELLPKMMEYFVASGDKPPLPACLERVSEADVLIVIVAHRYGWVRLRVSGGGGGGRQDSMIADPLYSFTSWAQAVGRGEGRSRDAADHDGLPWSCGAAGTL
jgi:hypothetical protein